MARATPAVETDSGDDGVRVWGEVKLTIRLGEYESVTVALGESRTVPTGSRRSARQRILDECEDLVEAKARKVRTYWKKQ
jgi:hypothetical protein